MLEQSFSAFELVIVDDGSTDGTSAIIQKFRDCDSRVKAYHLNHSGIARALNFGIKMSHGELIARMDADDYSTPDRLLKQYEYLQQHPETGLVSCRVKYEGDELENAGYAAHVKWLNVRLTHDEINLGRFQESPLAHPSVCFRRSLIARYGGYTEGAVPEDYELWLRWMHHGVKMEKINDILLHWSDLPNRLSRIHGHYSQESFYRVKAIYLEKYLTCLFGKATPEIWVWGAGRTTNNRVKHLISRGWKPTKYIDVKPRAEAASKFIHYADIPAPGNVFILSYVSDRKGKEQIYAHLKSLGYREGTDFLMMA